MEKPNSLKRERIPKFYWVNLGFSYKEVDQYKFLWAPESSQKNGKTYTNASWKTVQNVEQGDVIFCNENSRIIYVAVATADAYKAPRPDNRGYTEWEGSGYKVDVSLTVLKNKLEVKDFKNEFIELFNDRTSPLVFNVNSQVTQTYMCSLPRVAGAFLLNLVGEDSYDVQEALEIQTSDSKTIGKNKDVISSARLGQGKFRKDVLKLWRSKCAVTGISEKSLLIASHIVSWQLSNPEEKCDPFNGLPLSPNYDRLFDLGLIGFSDEGLLLLSPKLSNDTIEILGLKQTQKIFDIKPGNQPYLARHRELYKLGSKN